MHDAVRQAERKVGVAALEGFQVFAEPGPVRFGERRGCVDAFSEPDERGEIGEGSVSRYGRS